ncbi:MAG: secreted protein [Thermoleophilia bacterium]|nr:secreted protein [Thermoleophilia bacterium]
MDVVGGTFVGGTSQGWSIADPNANAAALGMAPVAAQPLYPTMGFTQPQLAQPALGAATLPVYGGGASAGGYPSDVYGIGGGTVGGSWSPEPIGNNQILYGHYSATGGLVMPQTQGVAAGAMPLANVPATGAAPATTAAGGAPAAATAPAAGAATDPAAAKKAADAKKAGAKPAAATDDKKDAAKPKTVTVKAGDSLSKIAAANGMDWKRLYELNKGVVGADPNKIKPGMTLKLA